MATKLSPLKITSDNEQSHFHLPCNFDNCQSCIISLLDLTYSMQKKHPILPSVEKEPEEGLWLSPLPTSSDFAEW